MFPIGAASGGEPASTWMRSISSSTSSSRPPALRARSSRSAAATTAAGGVRRAARAANPRRSGGGGEGRGGGLAARRGDRDRRQERRRRQVAEMLVDEVGRPPQRLLVDSGVEAEADERLGCGLARDAVCGKRDGIDGARDQVGT